MVSCASQLRSLAEHYLSIYLYDMARFYAERLWYEEKTQTSLHLLALTYFKSGKINQSYLLLKGSSSLENRYLFAQSCIQLSKFTEAEQALLPYSNYRPTNVNDDIIGKVPGGAAGLYLLGVISRRENRKSNAIEYFKLSLMVIYIINININKLFLLIFCHF